MDASIRRQHLILLMVVAGVLGVPLGVLTKRDLAYQLEKQKERARALRRWLIALGVLALAGSGITAYMQKQEAVRQGGLAR